MRSVKTAKGACVFRRFSLRVTLSFVFLLIAALVGVVTFFQIRSINQFSAIFNDLIENNFGRLDQLEDTRFNVLELERQAFTNIHDLGDRKAVDKAAQKAEIQTMLQNIQANEKAYGNLVEGDTRANVAVLRSVVYEAEELAASALAMLDSGLPSPAALDAMEERMEEQRQSVTQHLNAAIETETREITQESIEGDATAVRIINTNIIFAAATTAVALIMGLMVAEILSRSIGRVRQGAERIANGDFSRPIAVRSRDEIGQLAESFNKMAERLRDSYTRLALERQRDEILLESMSDGLIAINEQGNIVLVNSKAAELLEIAVRSTLMGRPLDEELVVYTKDDKPLPDDYRPARNALETGAATTDVFTYHKRDGQKIIVNITMSPVVLDGKASGVIMVIRDVTREMQIDRMKTEFISLASHQLRTPLSAIKWFSEMLVNGDAGELTPEQVDFAKNISDSTERMIQLVNSLLNISRIESGRIIVDPKPTDLHELITGIVNDLKGKTEERKQTLIVSVHDDLPKVNLDPRLISQVYMNLLTNAIKYTPKGGEISVFVSRKDDMLVSQVTDNGYGIPKGQHAKIFQKFFRAENVAKVETDGTGLGLYLIKAIVESSGGKIWFESEEGKGTTFWFSLPMSGMKAKEGEVTLDA